MHCATKAEQRADFQACDLKSVIKRKTGEELPNESELKQASMADACELVNDDIKN